MVASSMGLPTCRSSSMPGRSASNTRCLYPRSPRPGEATVGLRIAVHDYSGHPFQVQLSRALAGRGTTRPSTSTSTRFQTPRGLLGR